MVNTNLRIFLIIIFILLACFARVSAEENNTQVVEIEQSQYNELMDKLSEIDDKFTYEKEGEQENYIADIFDGIRLSLEYWAYLITFLVVILTWRTFFSH